MKYLHLWRNICLFISMSDLLCHFLLGNTFGLFEYALLIGNIIQFIGQLCIKDDSPAWLKGTHFATFVIIMMLRVLEIAL